MLTGRKAGKGQSEYLTFSLSDVLVSDYQTGGSEAEAPLDSIVAELLEDRGRLQQQKADGSLAPAIRVGWDRKTNKRSEPPGVALRRGPLSGAPVRADASRPPGDAGHALRAASRGARALPRARARLRRRGQPRADGGGAAGSEIRRHRRVAGGDRRGARARRGARPGNVTLEARPLEDFAAPTASFDYVIAHGVYSWVAPRSATPARPLPQRAGRARRGLRQLQHAARRAPARGAARHARLPHRRARPTRASASRRPARCCDSWRGLAERARARALMRGQAERLLERDDSSLLHDELRRDQRRRVLPRVRRARRRATGCSTWPRPSSSRCRSALPPSPAADALLAVDDVRREQYLDFLKGRMFRQTLLCRAGQAIDPTPRPAVVERLAFSTQAQAAASAARGRDLRGPDRLDPDHRPPRVIAALERAARTWPAAVWVRELARRSAERRRAVRRAAAQLRRQPRRPARPSARADHAPGARPARQRAGAPPGRRRGDA